MARAHAYTTPGPKSRSRQTPRTSTGGPCLGARGKQAQLAQANGSEFNRLLMLVAQMSTYPRAIALVPGQPLVRVDPVQGRVGTAAGQQGSRTAGGRA